MTAYYKKKAFYKGIADNSQKDQRSKMFRKGQNTFQDSAQCLVHTYLPKTCIHFSLHSQRSKDEVVKKLNLQGNDDQLFLSKLETINSEVFNDSDLVKEIYELTTKLNPKPEAPSKQNRTGILNRIRSIVKLPSISGPRT
uniref:Uncharacterized protein n=1 Tax=Cacopsylla melanoneura TaxID=428564 RepID=A0A8D8ZS22_9HEMI